VRAKSCCKIILVCASSAENGSSINKTKGFTAKVRAIAARYDAKASRIVVDLSNGCTFAFPPQLAPELAKATTEQLNEVEVLGAGYGLHWESLDTDLSVPGLMSGLFGARRYLAKVAGSATSPAKAAAARANGAKGGRPRKQQA
jgi:hypothetical protein